MIRTFFVILFVLLYLIIGIPVLGVFWLISKNEKWKNGAALAQLRLVQWAFRCICVISGVKLTVIGEEHVPKDEPVLYIGNHRSYFDIVISYARCPRLTGYIAKDSMLKIPLLSTWMKRLNSMCIYPEGTRGKGADELDMLPFKEGSLKIAEKTGCKIVPMAMTGSADIFEKHIPYIRKSRVILEYGAPIDITSLSKEEKKKLGSYCQAEITRMLENHRNM